VDTNGKVYILVIWVCFMVRKSDPWRKIDALHVNKLAKAYELYEAGRFSNNHGEVRISHLLNEVGLRGESYGISQMEEAYREGKMHNVRKGTGMPDEYPGRPGNWHTMEDAIAELDIKYQSE
jgi:hypothetical protein